MTNSTDPYLQLRPQGTAETEEVLHFPTRFRWGSATAAHQVEGGNTNNDWHAWEASGNVYGRQACGKACDWWNNAEADLKTASAMGQNTHRMSVEWSRIEPREGVWDDDAIDRYLLKHPTVSEAIELYQQFPHLGRWRARPRR